METHTGCVPQAELDLLLVHIDVMHVVFKYCRFAMQALGSSFQRDGEGDDAESITLTKLV